ncbi:unnamed protein product [Clonostachys chloroleuca]|uniref:Mitochondrial carrier n=1 Tax=Clonostachys chloroleuca TaxID=1926264 RepID=A0AA35QCC3_9HYPO|nr:unnamed protein product [Clonostachys chloroleuca]
MPNEKYQAPSPLQSIAAGAAAGGVESLVTLLGASSVSSLRLLTTVIREHGVGILYTGAGAFCISNASKSAVRFFTFDGVRSRLPKDSSTGKSTKLSNMIAGVAAGIAESVTVVTPGESIKTKIVEDRAGARKFTSTGHVIWSTLQAQGVRGLYRGVVPVTLKQGSNALVRFTSYHAIFDTIEPYLGRTGYGTFTAPVAGALAGIITVYATMPFDTIKTRMQGLSAGSGKIGTLQFLRMIYYESGVTGLWKGTTPRLLRLSVSKSLISTQFDQVVSN